MADGTVQVMRKPRAEATGKRGPLPQLVRTPTSVEFALRTWSEANMRGHWAKQRKRRGPQRMIARSFARYLERPALPCAVRLVRIAPRPLDDDNLRGALKECRDGVADWLGVDDGDERVSWQYGQERRGSYGVRIELSVPSPSAGGT